MSNKPFVSDQVRRAFDSVSPNARKPMLNLRGLIFEAAKALPAIGELEETLKWGEPAYITSQTKSGSLVRLGWKAKDPMNIRVLFHCQTNLVETFRTLFANELVFEGNRAIVLKVNEPLPKPALRLCIEAALTYRLSKGVK